MKKLLKYLDGWKTVIGYLLAQFLGSYPLLLTASQELLEDPQNKQKLFNFVAQLVIATGLTARVFKNFSGK